MGWSVEVHDRQQLREAAAQRRPRRQQPPPPRPIEQGVWQVPAGMPLLYLTCSTWLTTWLTTLETEPVARCTLEFAQRASGTCRQAVASSRCVAHCVPSAL